MKFVILLSLVLMTGYAEAQTIMQSTVRDATFSAMDALSKRQKVDEERDENPDEEEVFTLDEMKSLPIIYKKGAGGITFSTTRSEANELLQISSASSTATVDDSAVVWEGLMIRWPVGDAYKNAGPSDILVLPSYRGSMKIGDEVLKMNQNIEVKGGNEADLTQWTKKTFNVLEKKDKDFDCLEQKACAINWSYGGESELIVVDFGSMAIVVMRMDMRLVRILLKSQPGLSF